ncbi:hypothetical protein BGW42_001386, partial [Actinomortierella wolfii]
MGQKKDLLQFSASFFQRIDTLTTELLWDNRKAAISKDWLRQPKSAGGFGLLDVRHQCAALKAKWIARWNVAKPQWRDLFSAVTQSTYGLSSISEAIALLSLPTVRQTRNPHTRRGNSLTAVPHALWAFAQLDPVDKPPTLPPSTPPASSTAFADDIPLSRFSVGDARRYLDDKLFLKRQEKFEAGSDNAAPVYGRLRLKEPGKNEPYPDNWWDTVFKRTHSRLRTPKERSLMYRLAHHAIYTESERAKWKKDKDENDRGECKR